MFNGVLTVSDCCSFCMDLGTVEGSCGFWIWCGGGSGGFRIWGFGCGLISGVVGLCGCRLQWLCAGFCS